MQYRAVGSRVELMLGVAGNADRSGRGRHRTVRRALGRFEAAHRVFVLPGALVGVLGPVVQIFALPVLHRGHDVAFRGTVGTQLVGDHDSWSVLGGLEQLTQERTRRVRVTAAGLPAPQTNAALIHCPPQIMLHPVHTDHHLVQMPLVPKPGSPAPNLFRIIGTERLTPCTYRLVTDHDPAPGHQSRNVAQAQVEPVPQPDDLTDNDRRKPVPRKPRISIRIHTRHHPRATSQQPDNALRPTPLRQPRWRRRRRQRPAEDQVRRR